MVLQCAGNLKPGLNLDQYTHSLFMLLMIWNMVIASFYQIIFLFKHYLTY